MNLRPETRPRRRAAILVIDSLGVGALPDAGRYGDTGADTFGHIAEACATGQASEGRSGPLVVPELQRMGLAHAAAAAAGRWPPGIARDITPDSAWGWSRERSTGKDTISGHWEMAGQPVLFEWGYFRDRQESMPAALVDAMVARSGVPGFLGNCHASGTQIIEDLGEEHIRSGKPILYTSADSVVQICAHEEAFGLERLYALCEIARELCDEYRIGRVIARPFLGCTPADFKRTPNRRDYSVPPPGPTLLDHVIERGGEVVGVGKVPDIFAHQGISRKVKAHGIPGLMSATIDALLAGGDGTLVFTNLVDFDQEYGHRRDVAGYARALESFDGLLREFRSRCEPGDLLLLTADHGNDPTWPGSDHTREYVPVLAWGPGIAAGSIGCRESFADIGQSLAAWLGARSLAHGQSFLEQT